MGTRERKKRDKKRRYNAIVDAAEKVIFSKGIDQTTMIEIAREAELSKGTLYLYFKHKDELYMAIARRGSDLLHAQLIKLFSDDYTGLELIRMMGETYLDFVQHNPGYYNAFAYYEAIRDSEELEDSEVAKICEEKRHDVMALMVRALQIGMQDGTIQSSFDPKELAVLIWASTRGIIMMNHLRDTNHHFKILDQFDINEDSLYSNFIKLIGEGIATEKGKNL